MIHRVQGAGLTCLVDTAHGAKLTSLRSDNGYEWLTQSSPSPVPGRDADFTHPDMGGWDEIAPTVQPDITTDGTTLPGHGEVWNVPWTVLSGSATELALEIRLTTVPMTLKRVISATDTGLRLSYTATTNAVTPTPLLWCAHPQFANADQTTLVIESSGSPVDLIPIKVYPNEERFDIPLSRVHHSLPHGTSIKVFLDPKSRADTALLTVQGRTLRLNWQPSRLPYLGLFWDNCEFAQTPILAIEPSTAWGERLSSAMQTGRVLTVTAQTPAEWQLTLADTGHC